MKVNSIRTWTRVAACAGVAGLGVVAASAETGGTDSNPYTVISDRNVFHLMPPPPPPDPNPAPPVEVRKVLFSGFAGKGNSVKAYFVIPSKDNKQPPVYLSLAPGDRDDDIELVKIHLDKEEVEVVNAGTPMTLSIKENGYASGAPPAPAPMGGGIPIPGRPGRFNLPVTGPVPQAPPTAARDNSPLIIGGDNSSRNSSYGSAFVGGGQTAASAPGAGYGGGAYSPGGQPGNPGQQVANLLANPQTGQYRPPLPTSPPAPREIQAVSILVADKSGGPPAPPGIAEGMDGQQ